MSICKYILSLQTYFVTKDPTQLYFCRHFLEELSRRKYVSKDGLSHFEINFDNLELTEAQISRTMQCLQDVSVPVSLTWSHPDPSICPSSIAKHLFDSGLQVMQLFLV